LVCQAELAELDEQRVYDEEDKKLRFRQAWNVREIGESVRCAKEDGRVKRKMELAMKLEGDSRNTERNFLS
jgi:hypothetical protein